MSDKRQILKPTNDVAFKKLFENKLVVKEFINDSFKEEIVLEVLDIRLDSTRAADRFDCKVCIADILCETQDGELCTVEMQLNSQPGYMERVVYYAFGQFVDMMKRGGKNKNINSVYLIVVCDFTMFADCDWYSCHEMVNTTKLKETIGKVLTEDKIQSNFTFYKYVVLQLPKFDENMSLRLPDLDSIQLWMIFLKKANNLSEEERGILCERKPIMEDAIETLKKINFTTEEYQDYEACEDLLLINYIRNQIGLDAAIKERDEAKERARIANLEKDEAEERARIAEEAKERAKIATDEAKERARIAYETLERMKEELRGLKRKLEE